MELAGSPQWPKIYWYLRRVGLAPDKDGKEEGQIGQPSNRFEGEIPEETTEKQRPTTHQTGYTGFSAGRDGDPDYLSGTPSCNSVW